MIAVDTSVLVDAHRRETASHRVAASVLRDLAEGGRPWAIPWPCAYEFLSVVTNRRIWSDSVSTMAQAWAQLEAWLASPSHRLLGETPDFPPILRDFVTRPGVRGAVVHDARIAAICVAHGVDLLLTRDRDFSLFPEQRTRDPRRA